MFSEKDSLKNYLKKNPYILAPMVNHSDHPFRMLTRKYKAGLCFTPMLNSKLVITDKKYKKKMFHTSPKDRPLVLQLAGHDPETVLKAAELYENQIDIIDLNLGCPQNIAKKGNYGAYLMEDEELVYSIVRHCVGKLGIPFSVKIRVFKDRKRTMVFVKKLEALGICMLTVHGRTKEEKKQMIGDTDWEVIREIKRVLSIPVVANGGIAVFEDVRRCLEFTQCDAVMSAESILEYPALFDFNQGVFYDMDDLIDQYLDFVEIYQDQIGLVKSHLFKMFYTAFQVFFDLRDRLSKSREIKDFRAIARDVRERRKNWSLEKKIGWYYRYWKNGPEVTKQKNLKKQIQIEKEECTETISEFDNPLKKLKNE